VTTISKGAAGSGGNDILRAEYQAISVRALRLCATIQTQLDQLFLHNQVSLAAPIESRVKSWESIEEKLERKAAGLAKLSDITDLAGLRVILLFRQHLDSVASILRENFDVLSSEDASSRLTEAQFGYQSQHYIVRIRKEWLKVPTLSDIGDLVAEVQVRTLAQHVWAAASHKLQYKKESSVPPPLRRTIHRVSALLETVDLELQRVFQERQAYADRDAAALDPSERLNVDLLAAVLTETFPAENKKELEDYEDLLRDLFAMGVETASDLRDLLNRQKAEVMKEEMRYVRDPKLGVPGRRQDGVYFAHVGLARTALSYEFGEAFKESQKKKAK